MVKIKTNQKHMKVFSLHANWLFKIQHAIITRFPRYQLIKVNPVVN